MKILLGLLVASACFGQITLTSSVVNLLSGSSICGAGRVANGFAVSAGKLVVSCVAAAGAAGPAGATGATGKTGATGPAGASVIGATGPAGASVIGPAGPAGASVVGPAGPAGPAGPSGANGVAGASVTGPAGQNGLQGPAGPPGASTNGATGATGPAGPAGPAGPPGASVTGPPGATGAIGLTGAPGPAGASVIGPAGPAGAAGPAGPAGAVGPAGPAGTGTTTPLGVGWGLITDENGKASVNSAVALSWPDAEAAAQMWCPASGGTAHYVCGLKVKATAIPRVVMLAADVPCNGGCYLDVDVTGSKAIKFNDGGGIDATLRVGIRILAYDGTVWRLLL